MLWEETSRAVCGAGRERSTRESLRGLENVEIMAVGLGRTRGIGQNTAKAKQLH